MLCEQHSWLDVLKVPNAPANVGTYQFFCVVALAWFGIDNPLAAGFSVVVFVILTIPLWVLGFLALGRAGVTLASVRAQIDVTRSSVARGHGSIEG